MYEYKAQVVRVVDADTIDFMVDLGFESYRKIRFRLSRIDAWEVRGEERPDGLEATQFVLDAFAAMEDGEYIVVRTVLDNKGGYKTGSFKRYLADVIIMTAEGEVKFNLNDRLVKEGHAEYAEY